MDTILVTGVSAGFGAAICQRFIETGARVIGLARRADRLEALRQQHGEFFIPLAVDIRDETRLKQALASLAAQGFIPDVLVNNAGLALGLTAAQAADFEDWRQMIETNVVGLTFLTQQLLPAMVAKGRGHVINIGSVAGNYAYPGGNIYGATKAFVKQFSRGLRADLAGSGVRVTNIEPGLCGDTEFSLVRFKGDGARAKALYENVAYLRPEDIAEAVLWAYQQPAHVNIECIELMPEAQSFSALAVHRH